MGDASATKVKRPQWLADIRRRTIAVFTLDDGERVTADVLRIDDNCHKLTVDVVASNRLDATSARCGRVIPASRVVSVERRSRAEQPWPYSDPCRGAPVSLARVAVFVPLVLCMVFGSLLLFIFLGNRPYGVQVASAFAYTFLLVGITFGNGRGYLPAYMFTCPAVRTQYPRLLWRHLGFLVALFALQTGVLAVRPHLPAWWNTDIGGPRGDPPFEYALFLLCFGLAWTENLTNRRLLDRAHREFAL